MAFDLQKVYDEMSEAFGGFQTSSGLSCLSGCGNCCKNPEIEASPLEMIPWALKIYDSGQSDEWLSHLSSSKQDSCLLLVNEKCISYGERPSICRMFGVSGYFDKHHQKTLSICRYIREANESMAMNAQAEEAPVMASWSSKLSSLGSVEDSQKRPVNEAMKRALEKVSTHFYYLSGDEHSR